MSPRGTKTRASRTRKPAAPESEPLDECGAAVTQARVPSQEEVARRAHELYLERGGREGSEVEDWLRAEAELVRRRG